MHGRNDNDDTQAGIAAAAASESASDNAVSARIAPDVPVVEASTLFGSHRQVVIGHNGCRYVLRITRHGKLILNK
jgi:hemin uptake protein HemP